MKAIEILASLIEELDDKAYEFMPSDRDYYYLGVAEQMVLDKKKEIADELYEIVDKYKELYYALEEDN